jgi:hypothetical protein
VNAISHPPQGEAHPSVACVVEADDFPLGAHLVTPRIGFAHHGIYVGNGCVVHYAGLSRSLRRGPVEEVSLAVFGNGKTVTLRSDGKARYAAVVVVERARSRVGENRYRVATNNCEHFCTWCLRGEERSEQIERLLCLPRAATGALKRLGRLLSDAAAPNLRPSSL